MYCLNQGSSNPHNSKATFDALLQMRSAHTVARQRGVSLEKFLRLIQGNYG
jgi:small subunit ribosomal protein S5